jgi:hypothetical protein
VNDTKLKPSRMQLVKQRDLGSVAIYFFSMCGAKYAKAVAHTGEKQRVVHTLANAVAHTGGKQRVVHTLAKAVAHIVKVGAQRDPISSRDPLQAPPALRAKSENEQSIKTSWGLGSAVRSARSELIETASGSKTKKELNCIGNPLVLGKQSEASAAATATCKLSTSSLQLSRALQRSTALNTAFYTSLSSLQQKWPIKRFSLPLSRVRLRCERDVSTKSEGYIALSEGNLAKYENCQNSHQS